MKLFELEARPYQEKEFPRSIMPQIRKEHLIDSPFDFQTGEVPISKLKPVQSQRVKGMHDKAKRGFDDGTIRPIIIDNDNFIVNGHHRYDIARGMDMEDVDVIKVDATIEELIKHYSNTADKQPTIEDKWKKNLKKKIKKMPKKISGSNSNILFNLGLAETIEAGQDFNALLQGIESDLKQREKDLKKLPKKSIYDENFKDGKKPGRKGLAKRSGVNTKASVSSLRKTAKNSTGEKQRMAHWLANMKSGKKKSK